MISVNQRLPGEPSSAGHGEEPAASMKTMMQPDGDAGLGVRDDDAPMDAPPRRAKVARRLDLVAVERFRWRCRAGTA